MTLEITDEHRELGSTVRRFLADAAPLSWVRGMLDDPRGTTDEVWRGLSGLGVLGLLAPGSGAGMVEMGVVLEELGRAVHPSPVASSAVGAMGLLRGIAPDDELVEPLAAGEVVGTVALYEPDQRWGWRSPGTTLDGKGRVTGEKVHVGDGAAADVLLVVTDRGVAVVETDAPGVAVEPVDGVDGTRKRASMRFDGAPGRLVGDDRDAVAETVDLLVVATVLDALGAAQAAFEMAVAYAHERHQFGVPIGSFQAVQHLLTDSLVRLKQSRASAYAALPVVDEDPLARHRAATVAKAFASEALYRVGADAIQVLGGVGYTWEHDVHLFYKRLLSAQHDHGGEDEHLDELARLMIDAPEGQPA